MNSSIYEGTIRHRRYRPRANHFQYRLFFMYLDLAELPTLFDGHPPWSFEKPNLAYFRRADHFGDPRQPMDTAVRELVRQHTGQSPQGPIRMLTHPRYFGHCFNPATFYYCFDKTDRNLETIIVEIHNTPWGEVFCYVLPAARNEHPLKEWRRHRFGKAFHVSPFIDMDIRYDWRFKVPGDEIRVHMIDYQQDTLLFDASLQLRKRPITHGNLTRMLFSYPPMTVKVIAMIYFQALKLAIKKTPFYSHPKKKA
ncbi:MAG: DUF1365 domain-containing protein [Desulfobacteraceae bacterium]|nr:DUF1365 domain-containing protein [Desulfobacteraceae bacterium]